MHQQQNDPTIPTPDAAGCPECGSDRLRYRVQHTGVSHRPLQERSLLWECRQCATRWAEQLYATPRVVPLHAPPVA